MRLIQHPFEAPLLNGIPCYDHANWTPIFLSTQIRKMVIALANTALTGQRLCILPVFTAIFILVTFLISYGISVSQDHVEAFLPYISYTANHNPSRSIFAQLTNIGALVLLPANFVIRYLHISEVLRMRGAACKATVTNTVCLSIGLASALGLNIVANFQSRNTTLRVYQTSGIHQRGRTRPHHKSLVALPCVEF
ncbi:DNA damage-regulated autophagy modulator protein 2 [Plakobranchus ocellatus]|uniref:DNA damage-regulated autophagy modulator protein 2 n=1 Tax=Plakobranchus ocellatus TaxID=259542 RepID=A0AAV4CIH2_9GAST|nr:DNA damage-regulated autophagy modulator protein 2 [Plakobranchus ocellatus]